MSLDPTLQRLIAKAYLNGFGNLHHFTAEQMRRYLTHPHLKIKTVPYQSFETPQALPLRCYYPAERAFSEALPAVIYLSATAFVLDRLDSNDEYCSLLASTLDMKVINVAHRLAPEHKFPRFLEDCIDSIKWVFHQANRLAIVPNKIALWGESSGGSIAATATHLLRDEKENYIQHQTLFYPMVDLVTPFPSKEKYGKGFMLDSTFIQWLDTQGFHPWQNRADPLVSPLLFSSFNDLPPTTFITAEYDPLRDEGEAYVEKLKNAQVPVTAKRYPGVIHGFMRFYHKVKAAKEALHFASTALKNYFIV